MGKSLPTPGVSGGAPPFLLGLFDVLLVGGALIVFCELALHFWQSLSRIIYG